jgi:hypothetical protein
MIRLVAVLITATLTFLALAAAIPSQQPRAARPEVWCADPWQTDSGPLQFCEFKLRDA